jgi:drug/metabolite transporter (DMT)-like permease
LKPVRSNLLALAAIGLWASLASLGVLLSHVPPLLLTGLGLLMGSLVALPLSRLQWQAWRVPLRTLLLGVYGLFGFHLLLFLALRHAPAIEANLINYLWPLGMVVLAPWLLPGVPLRWQHVAAACLGFAGAALAIMGRSSDTTDGYAGMPWGYVLALGSAFIWASYSLWTRRAPAFPTAAVGSFALCSGLLALWCHVWLEPATVLSGTDLLWIAILGLGPLGGAFFLWDAALKQGDPQHIGLLAFLTPPLSTMLLLVTQGQPLRWSIVMATAMVVAAAFWGSRK